MEKELELIDSNKLSLFDYYLLFYYMFCPKEFIEIIKNKDKISNNEEKAKAYISYTLLNYFLDKKFLMTEFQNALHEEIDGKIAQNQKTSSSYLSFCLNNSSFIVKTEYNKKAYFQLNCSDNHGSIENNTNSSKNFVKKVCNKINKFIKIFSSNNKNLFLEISKKISLLDIKKLSFFSNIKKQEITIILDNLISKNKVPEKENRNLYVANDKQKLINYLKRITEIEGDIYSLQKRYLFLESKLNYYIEKHDFTSTINDYLLDYFIDLLSLENDMNNYKSNIPNINSFMKEIEKPTFTNIEPIKPILKSSNIFNRKKVLKENEKIKQQYEIECREFEKAKKNYLTLLEEYEKNIEDMQKNAKIEYEIALEKYNNEINSNKIAKETMKKIQLKMEEINLIKENPEIIVKKALENDNEFKNAEKISYEMNYIVQCLNDCICVREKLYSYNVIYGKYRNYVALSSIIDYLLSGRCDLLDGKDGAYNMYEQESRTDTIINKLDVIINKLDEISKNQYYLYSELCEINNSLSNIENLLLVNDILQVAQVSELSKIIDNTNKIAYNTEVVSYYSQKIAHYSEALTYLHLLN